MSGPIPKPKKPGRKSRKKLGPNAKTKVRRKLYRELVRPAYLAGLAAGQERRGEWACCERCGTHAALEIHHMAGRQGDLMLDYTTMVALCPSCHRFCHDHPEEARQEGWMLSRTQTRPSVSTEEIVE